MVWGAVRGGRGAVGFGCQIRNQRHQKRKFFPNCKKNSKRKLVQNSDARFGDPFGGTGEGGSQTPRLTLQVNRTVEVWHVQRGRGGCAKFCPCRVAPGRGSDAAESRNFIGIVWHAIPGMPNLQFTSRRTVGPRTTTRQENNNKGISPML